jgi:glucokinase
VASASAIRLAYQDASGQEVSGAEDVVERLGRDAVADRVWREATDALGDALLTVSALLAPGGIVLGGGLAEAGRTMLDPVRARMQAGALAVQVPPLLLAAHGSRAGVIGAGLLALDEVRRR